MGGIKAEPLRKKMKLEEKNIPKKMMINKLEGVKALVVGPLKKITFFAASLSNIGFLDRL